MGAVIGFAGMTKSEGNPKDQMTKRFRARRLPFGLWALLIPASFVIGISSLGAAPPLELRGLLIPVEQANLAAPSAGVIREIRNEGDRVKGREVVAQLEDAMERAGVEQARAILKLRQAQADSSAKLRKNNATSEEDARVAVANLETAVAQLRQAEAALEKKSLRAPFDGVVTKRIRATGEAVDQYFPVMVMVNPDRLWLEAFVPAARLGEVRAGAPVEVQAPDAAPGRTFAGKVDFIAPNVDPASGEVRVKVLVDHTDGALRPGLSAAGRLGADPAETKPPVVSGRASG